MNFLDRGDTAYGQFVNKYLNDYVYGEVHDLPSTLDELLPMPLPFPEVEGGRGAPCLASRRRRSRATARWAAMRWTNRIVASLIFLDEELDRDGPWRRAQLSPRQRACAAALLEDVLGWCRRPVELDAGRSGRTSTLVEVTRRLASGYDGNDLNSLVATALPVKNERVAVPAAAGGVDPMMYLNDKEKKEFSDWGARELPGSRRAAGCKPCHRVSPSEELLVGKRLCDAGMVSLLTETEIRETRALARGERVADWKETLDVGGLFAVKHKSASDRLIYDRRPRNEKELRFAWASLPAGVQWSQVVLRDNECLRGSLEDLSTYFYCLKQAPHGNVFNLVGRPKLGSEWKAGGCEVADDKLHEKLFMGLEVQGMGDLNAVDIAQRTHEEILYGGGALLPTCQVQYDLTVPAGDVWQGLYIDDFITTWVCPKSRRLEVKGTPDGELVLAAEQIYDKTEGLKRATEKSVRFETKFKVLGMMIDGWKGEIAAPPERMQQVVSVLCALVKCGRSDKKTMERLLGAVNSILMVRRELLCILAQCYVIVEGWEYGVLYRLPPALSEELSMIALLVPLARAFLRWPLACEISATDATPSAEGATRATVSESAVRSLYRLAEHRGEHVRLDWCGSALHEEGFQTRMQRPTAKTDQLACDLPWRIVRSRSFPRVEHVNIQELAAIANELRDIAFRSDLLGSRHICLTDSRVALGAWAKGRSSARRLNAVLRRALGSLVLGRLRLSCIWISTGVNPADHPSRFRELPRGGPPECGGDPCWQLNVKTEDIEAEVPQSTAPLSAPLRRSGGSTHLSNMSSETQLCWRAIAGQRCSTSFIPLSQAESQTAPFFVELWAGTGHLSSAMLNAGFKVLEPIDAFSKGKYCEEQDLKRPQVRARFLRLAKAGRIFGLHCGITCTTFSQLFRLWGGGTRSVDRPEGDGSRRVEREANSDASFMCELVRAIGSAGGWATVENPWSSYLKHLAVVKRLCRDLGTYAVRVDMCAYGLGPPRGATREFWNKRTLFLSTCSEFKNLERRCNGDHLHTHVKGTVVVSGRRLDRSSLAAAYPLELCKHYAQCALLACQGGQAGQ